MSALEQIERWEVHHAAGALITPNGVVAMAGDTDRRFELASVTKPLTAYSALIAVEETTIGLDEPCGPEGSTVAHLLAHASGLSFDNPAQTLAGVGERRIYSNVGYEALAEEVAHSADMTFAEFAKDGVFDPLGMSDTTLVGSPAAGAVATVGDVSKFVAECFAPKLLSPTTLLRATTVAFPGLSGVVPGFGRYDPCDWGLGFEIKSQKAPHWTGRLNSPRTFGHFGQSGTFIWIDPEVDLGLVVLTDRPFGDWAKVAWPQLSNDVLSEMGIAPN